MAAPGPQQSHRILRLHVICTACGGEGGGSSILPPHQGSPVFSLPALTLGAQLVERLPVHAATPASWPPFPPTTLVTPADQPLPVSAWQTFFSTSSSSLESRPARLLTHEAKADTGSGKHLRTVDSVP